MSGLSLVERVLSVLEIVATIALLIRLFLSKLNSTYPVFTVYLVVRVLQGVIPPMVPANTKTYANLFMISEAVVIVCTAFVVLELYSLVLRDLPGLARIARRFVRIALGLSIVVSLLLLFFEQFSSNLLVGFFVFERAITSSLLFFVFLITGFLVYYPVPLNRNVITYTIGYAVFFLTGSATLFLATAGPGAGPATYMATVLDNILNDTLLVVSVSCLVFWTISLNRQGETRTHVFGHQWRPQDEGRLLQQLQNINANLVRAAKK